mmetsp:Transcript_61173/g.162558  ORF Transcript_61173/g.162558 Transcript_61173/m.162558 type:complete len:198 (-) Transcript_61173:136-729(-)
MAAEGTVVEVTQTEVAPASETTVATRDPKKPRILKVGFGHITAKNIGQLKKLNSATFPVHYKDKFYQDLLGWLDYSRLGYYADILVGSVCCRLEARVEGGKTLYVMTLSVLKAYQRHGMASQLLRWAVERAEGPDGDADDVRELYLHVQTSNEAAISFYKSFGFEIAEEIKDFYSKIDPPDCYILRRPVLRKTPSQA